MQKSATVNFYELPLVASNTLVFALKIFLKLNKVRTVVLVQRPKSFATKYMEVYCYDFQIWAPPWLFS